MNKILSYFIKILLFGQLMIGSALYSASFADPKGFLDEAFFNDPKEASLHIHSDHEGDGFLWTLLKDQGDALEELALKPSQTVTTAPMPHTATDLPSSSGQHRLLGERGYLYDLVANSPHDNFKEVEWALKKSCSPNDSSFSESVLVLAAGLGKIQVVKILLAARAYIDMRGGIYPSALIQAAKGGHHKIMVDLLKDLDPKEAQAYINAKDQADATALMYAAASGNLLAVNELINRGADISARDTHWATAVTYAGWSKGVNHPIVTVLRECSIVQGKEFAGQKDLPILDGKTKGSYQKEFQEAQESRERPAKISKTLKN